MSNATVAYFVHRDVDQAVRGLLTGDPSFTSLAETFADDAATFFAGPRAADPALYAVVVVPPGWADPSFPIPAAGHERIRAGTLRVVIWDAVARPAWDVALTLVPASIGDEARRLLLNHLIRRPAFGLPMILPAGARILSERIRTEAQIAAKIEKSVEFIVGTTPDFSERTLPIRLGLTALFAAALGTEAARKGGKPPAYQIGVAGSITACAVRWATADFGEDAWAAPGPEWRMLFARALMSLVVFNPATGETEVTLAYDVAGTVNDLGPGPLALDVLTTERQRRGRALGEETQFAFEYFENQEAAADQTTFVTTKTVANPNLEAHGLRVEYHKLGLQFKELQDVSNDYLRRMAQAIESEKVARAELQTLRVQVDYGKEKESELTRKLQSVMDQYATLKLEKKKKKAG